jgi:hypothetical protein
MVHVILQNNKVSVYLSLKFKNGVKSKFLSRVGKLITEQVMKFGGSLLKIRAIWMKNELNRTSLEEKLGTIF